MPSDIATVVERILHQGTDVEDEDVYSVLWDFGGQSVYYVTHPLFLTPRAIYVLVNDLSRNPWERGNHPKQQEMFKRFKDEFCLKSNLDYVDSWMSSVASISSPDEDHQIHPSPKYEALPAKLPPVFLVCSHADKPHDGMDPCTLANEIFDCLQRKPYSTHLVENVYVVNNTLSGSEYECPEVVRLRQDILAVAQKLPQMKELIPVEWLKYERALHITEKDGHKWISLESAKQIASEVCQIVDDQEFLALLNFLHDQRIIIHFDDTPELCKFVVLDPQWLIDVFSRVITVQPYVHKDSCCVPRLMLQFFQWGLDEFWSSVNPHLYQNFARFYTSGDQDCSVILLCHSSSIEVVVHRGNLSSNMADSLHSKLNLCDDTFDDSFEKVCACTVDRQLSLTLESMRKEFF